MKTHVHIIHQDVKELHVKILDYSDEILILKSFSVPDEVLKERSDLMLTRKRTDPVVRLYAEVEPTNSIGLFIISDWEVRQFTQDDIDKISSDIIYAMTNSMAYDVFKSIKSSMPDVPDIMLGISMMNAFLRSQI